MILGPDETARVKVLTAGDEGALEDKINEYLESHTDQILADLKVEQVEYHSRQGVTDFGLLAVLVMRIRK